MKKKFFVKKNHEFQKIIKINNQFFFNNFIIFIDKNNYNHVRFGLSVGKKRYRLATTRNHIKRQLRHIITSYVNDNKNFINLPIDIIIMFKVKNYQKTKFNDIKINLFNALEIIYKKNYKHIQK